MSKFKKILLWSMPAIYLAASVWFFTNGFDYLSHKQNLIMGVIMLGYGVFRLVRSYRISRGIFSLLILLNLSSFSCNHKVNDKKLDTPTTGDIKMVVDETFMPVIKAQLDVFHAVYKYARIEAIPLPENDAFNMLFADSAKLILASRKLTDKELQYFNNKKIFPKQVKIATDAIALIVNRENPDSIFTMSQLVAILKGEVTDWNQVNKNNHLGPIDLVFDNPQSGVVRYMVDSVAKSTTLSKQLTAATVNTDVIDFVLSHKNAAGLIGVSWVSDREDTTHLFFQSKIRIARLGLQRTDTFRPFQAYIATKQYPLTRDIYLISTDPHKGLADGFIAFAASDKGQRIILKSGIVPAIAPIRLIQVRDE